MADQNNRRERRDSDFMLLMSIIRYNGGFTYPEHKWPAVAATMGVSVDTVKARWVEFVKIYWDSLDERPDNDRVNPPRASSSANPAPTRRQR
ncbi:hypothetical protein PG987_015599 [Apiospora arundinis]